MSVRHPTHSYDPHPKLLIKEGNDLEKIKIYDWYSLALINSDLLLSHEYYDNNVVNCLMEKIKNSGVWTEPIVVDNNNFIVLDGHHRLEAARRLALHKVPCACIDYDSDIIDVSAWRQGETIDRTAVREAALSGKLLPIKTSRHSFSKPIVIEKVSLAYLKQGTSPHE